LPFLFGLLIINIYGKDYSIEILKQLSMYPPNDLYVILLSILICGIACLNWGQIPKLHPKAHVIIAICELIIFSSILIFLGIIAFNFIEASGSRYDKRSLPWVAVLVLSWSLHHFIKEYRKDIKQKTNTH
jgi:hypothetical protein